MRKDEKKWTKVRPTTKKGERNQLYVFKFTSSLLNQKSYLQSSYM